MIPPRWMDGWHWISECTNAESTYDANKIFPSQKHLLVPLGTPFMLGMFLLVEQLAPILPLPTLPHALQNVTMTLPAAALSTV